MNTNILKIIVLIWLLTLKVEAGDIESEVADGPFMYSPAPRSPGCRPMQPGQSMTLNQSADDSNTGIPKKYRLTRDARNPDLYIAEFNIEFVPMAETVREVYADVIPADQARAKPPQVMRDTIRDLMMARTRYCFSQMQNRLTAPDGTRIELRLADSTATNPPPLTAIRVSTEGARANSEAWPRQISCPTIVHEVMHLMGLCDGYRETGIRISDDGNVIHGQPPKIPPADPGKVPSTFAYNCRSIEPQDSIMSNQSILLENRIEFYVCPGSAIPGRLSERTDTFPSQCPDGTTGTLRQMPRTQFMSMLQRERNLSNDERHFYYYRNMPPISQTLLPAQMRMITLPLCRELNQNYITCAQNAYRTLQWTGCVNVPPFCQTTDYLR